MCNVGIVAVENWSPHIVEVRLHISTAWPYFCVPIRDSFVGVRNLELSSSHLFSWQHFITLKGENANELTRMYYLSYLWSCKGGKRIVRTCALNAGFSGVLLGIPPSGHPKIALAL